MLERLALLEERYEELLRMQEDPAVYGDVAALRKVNREIKELTDVVEAYRAYRAVEDDIEAATQMLADPEMKEFAQEELALGKEKLAAMQETLRVLLLPRDPNDEKNVIMEIRGGVGGEEGMLFAADLFRMYSMYAESRRWKIDVVSANETEMGGIK